MIPPQGLWLPLITPFHDDRLDEASLRRLVRHYATQPVDGLILAATTGEGLTLEAHETERLVDIVAAEQDAIGWHIPRYLGVCGSFTRTLVHTLETTASWPLDGYLIACPYYTRPSQEGLYQHFAAAAAATARPILIYNIPYRTGVNLGNATMLRLARLRAAGLGTIVGVKDCCADVAQSRELLQTRDPGFAVLTGEDADFLTALTLGADGGITASAHILTALFARVRDTVRTGDLPAAQAAWNRIAALPRMLFSEPSPAPIKHWLWLNGLIRSPEVRLPMTAITSELAARLDQQINRFALASS